MKISQFYVSYTSVQLKSKKKKEKLLELILQNKEMNQERKETRDPGNKRPHIGRRAARPESRGRAWREVIRETQWTHSFLNMANE